MVRTSLRSVDELDDVRQVGWPTALLGGQPGDADLLEAVALGQVAERLVAGDEVGALAVGQALPRTRRRARRARLTERLGVGPVVRRVLSGRRSARVSANAVDDLDQAGGVEPEVRVGDAGLVVVIVLVVRLLVGVLVLLRWCDRSQLDVASRASNRRRRIDDGIVDRGLEARRGRRRVGILDRADVAGCQLQIVGLGTGLGQAGHLDPLATDLLGHPLERVERRNDPDPVTAWSVPSRPARTAAGQRC